MTIAYMTIASQLGEELIYRYYQGKIVDGTSRYATYTKVDPATSLPLTLYTSC